MSDIVLRFDEENEKDEPSSRPLPLEGGSAFAGDSSAVLVGICWLAVETNDDGGIGSGNIVCSEKDDGDDDDPSIRPVTLSCWATFRNLTRRS